MTARSMNVLDVREILRRLRLGQKDREIERETGVSRHTIRKYAKWAHDEGFLAAAELPEAEVLHQRLKETQPGESGPSSTLDAHREFIEQKLLEGVELVALLGLLRERGFTGSYSALRNFVRHVKATRPEAFLRVETAPGEEAQVDFGYVGELFDPVLKRLRKAWVFVMTLCFSRHHYAEIVFDQRVETWIELHVRAFEFFGGWPERIVVDNLKAAITRAVVHDAEAQRSYRALAEHYGFTIAPCRPRTPRHKGKVESGVRYVKRNALAGRTFPDIHEANEHLKRWVLETAGVRDHGTTHEKPLTRFEAEKPHLKPLPATRYEVTVWKRAKLHPDCHVVFDYAYYSAPFRYVGQELWLKATPRRIELYHEHERIATHPRAARRGERSSLADHFPPDKLQGLLPVPMQLKEHARSVGPATAEVIERLLGDKPMDRLRSAQAILRLGRVHGDKRLEAACRRALAHDDIRWQVIKNILVKALDLDPIVRETGGPLPKTSVFARHASDFVTPNLN